MTSSRQEVLLAEYRAAQSSAEYHDKLLWTVTSIFWLGSLTLMGFIVKSKIISPIILILPILGILIHIFLLIAQNDFRRWKNQKYARCKEIEFILGMNHHLRAEKGGQTKIYITIMILFIISWAILFFWILFKSCSIMLFLCLL